MLEIQKISKQFQRGRDAVRDVTFTVNRGEIFGLLGHNGAGKSTTLGIILGLVHPSSGDVKIDGVSVLEKREVAMRQVGAIFEAPVFYDYLSGWDNLRMLTALSGFRDEAAIRDAVELVRLTDRVHSKVGSYSHGMRQRLALAQALLPQPKLLLLDEPTDGLDPEGIHEFRETILKLRKELGLTILFNSHLLAEVEQVCDRIAIMKAGHLIYVGGLEKLSSGQDQYFLEVNDWIAAAPILEKLGGSVHQDGLITLPAGSDPADLIYFLVEAGLRVRQLARREQDLEQFYLEMTRK